MCLRITLVVHLEIIVTDLGLLSMNMDVVTAQIISEWDVEPNHFGEHASSPESSMDSVCSSPEMFCPSGSQKEFSFGYSGRRAGNTTQRHSTSKMSTKRRMKASEREKLRMRSLAEALHQLRDYLPPDYTKRGQPLTKIQTLKYTIAYINKLSDILSHA